jgi:hypothetical protein
LLKTILFWLVLVAVIVLVWNFAQTFQIRP